MAQNQTHHVDQRRQTPSPRSQSPRSVLRSSGLVFESSPGEVVDGLTLDRDVLKSRALFKRTWTSEVENTNPQILRELECNTS